jgi:hypothetical protein
VERSYCWRLIMTLTDSLAFRAGIGVAAPRSSALTMVLCAQDSPSPGTEALTLAPVSGEVIAPIRLASGPVEREPEAAPAKALRERPHSDRIAAIRDL